MSLDKLAATIASRKGADPDTSWTAKLLSRGPEKCAEKFGEEAVEAIIEAVKGDRARLTSEAADVLYHLLVMLASRDVALEDVLAENPPTVIPGMRPLLTELDAAGIPAAIVTNATSEVARYTAGLAPDNLFRVIIGDEEVAQGVRAKPDPDAYLQAARRLGVEPRDCVVVEDSPSGAAAGVAAGIPTVVVPGVQDVPAGPGIVHVPSHSAVTLELLRSLGPRE